ncbi:polyphosphate kinase 2 family protein [soil metagenome]
MSKHLDLNKLSANPPKDAPSRKKAEKETEQLRESISGWQQKLFASGKDALLIVLQGMDGSGKDGAVRHVLGGVNPSGVTVHAFKQPTPDEIAHDFLWRAHAVTPPRGTIGVFNRSYYEDVLVVRVHADKLMPAHLKAIDNPWKHRYSQIENFEALLTESGTRILKFFLHISKDEQRDRILSRQKSPEKQFKFNTGDLAEREHWDEYMKYYEDVLEKTSFKFAPWKIVPADHKWYRNLVLAREIEKALADIAPEFPGISSELAAVKIA